jgi:hypothetical protein
MASNQSIANSGAQAKGPALLLRNLCKSFADVVGRTAQARPQRSKFVKA